MPTRSARIFPALPVWLSLVALTGASAQPAPAPTAPAQAANPDGLPTADALLTRLETADRDLKTLKAGVRYITDTGALEGNTRQAREGEIFFRIAETGSKARAFAVVFDKLRVGDVERKEKQGYICDGAWLIEKNYDDKQMTRRQIVEPGRTMDPFRIGEGPFPVPVGQKKEDVLRIFTVESVDAFDGLPDKGNEARIRGAVKDTYQLKLVPRPGTDEARKFREVRFWYRTQDLLPRLVRTIEKDGKSAEVLLINLERNAPLEPGLFDTSPPDASEKWVVETKPFRKATDEGEKPRP